MDAPHVIEERNRQIKSDFGSKAEQVFSLLGVLELYGIYYSDPHSRNIRFADE